MYNTKLNLNDVITVGLTCLEQNIDDKQEVKERILNAVQDEINKSFKQENELEDISIVMLTLLFIRFGIGFDVNNGKITGVNFDNFPISFQRL